MAGDICWHFVRLVPVKLITGVSGRWIAFWAVLVCSVGTRKGVQRRGRMAEVFRWSASWRDYDNDDTLCATGKNGISHGRNPVGGAYSEKCQSVFLWNSVCFFAGCIAAVSVGKCGEIRKCGKDGGRRDPDTWRDSIEWSFLLPAVLGYDRVAAAVRYPVLLSCWQAQIFREMYWPDLTSCGWDFCFTACFCNRESAVLWKSDYREISSW